MSGSVSCSPPPCTSEFSPGREKFCGPRGSWPWSLLCPQTPGVQIPVLPLLVMGPWVKELTPLIKTCPGALPLLPACWVLGEATGFGDFPGLRRGESPRMTESQDLDPSLALSPMLIAARLRVAVPGGVGDRWDRYQELEVPSLFPFPSSISPLCHASLWLHGATGDLGRRDDPEKKSQSL